MQEKRRKKRFIYLASCRGKTAHVTIRKKQKGDERVCEEMTRRIVCALETIRCGASCSEDELHSQVAQALAEGGVQAEHEVRLAPRCRIDFLSERVGIEIKKSRPERAKLIEQLTRYAACEQIEALVVAAPRGVNLPKSIGGKPVTLVALERLWGISLP